MSRGKYLSLEEARRGETRGATIKQFCKEHPSKAEGPLFRRLLDSMARGTLEGGETSDQGTSEGYSGTQTPPGTSGDTSD